MAGRILIYDGIATNRIILRCKLSAACYDVMQANSVSDLATIARRDAPDLVLIDSGNDPDAGIALCEKLARSQGGDSCPILLIAGATTPELRAQALAAGAAELLGKPLHDDLLLASVRRLLRQKGALEEYGDRAEPGQQLGMMEAACEIEAPARIALVAPSDDIGLAWQSAMQRQSSLALNLISVDQALAPWPEDTAPDIFVIAAGNGKARSGLRLLADLRSRTDTRNSGIILVMDTPEASDRDAQSENAAMALDLGANDLLLNGFHVEELTQRVAIQLRQKRQRDKIRRSVQAGLRMAARDPLTGLYNRRFALPRLQHLIEASGKTQRPLAVMILDLDRFKRVNDTYGHATGDSVLVEVARRLTKTLGARALISRLGGEEFMIVLPDTKVHEARKTAELVQGLIRNAGFQVDGVPQGISITVSIGVAFTGGAGCWSPSSQETLMQEADSALYLAKADGRDQITLARPAA